MKVLVFVCLVAVARANFFDSLGHSLGGVVDQVGDGVKGAANAVGGAIVQGAHTVGDGVQTAAGAVAGALPSIGETLGSTFGDIWNVVQDPLEEAGKELLIKAGEMALQEGLTLALDALAAGKRESAMSPEDIKMALGSALVNEYGQWLKDTKNQVLGSKTELINHMLTTPVRKLPQNLKDYVTQFAHAKSTGTMSTFIRSHAHEINIVALERIGRELTKALVNRGAEVYGFGRNAEQLASLAYECGSKAHLQQLDVSDWETTRAVVKRLPPMHGLVNNAGISSPSIKSLNAKKEDIERVFAVNIMAALNITQVVGKKMIESEIGGSIVNVSSLAGLKPQPRVLAYAMSKAALDMMTAQLALELGPSGIRVNSVNPGVVIRTDMSEPYFAPETMERVIKITPMQRYIEMKEIVEPIMFLLSESSGMVSGTTNRVDGGLLCGYKF